MSSKKINILGLTQGANIDVFLNLNKSLMKKTTIGKVGIYTSLASYFYSSNLVKDFENIEYIKEWEIVRSSKKKKLDIEFLEKFEKSIHPNNIWDAIIADRRLIYGPRSKYFEDYKPLFTYNEMLKIAQEFIKKFEKFINVIQPNYALGFTPVTFGEMLAYFILKKNNIPIYLLHSSRLENYFAFHDKLIGTSNHIKELMDKNSFSNDINILVNKYLSHINKSGIKYEGVNLSLAKKNKINFFLAFKELPGVLRSDFKKYLDPVLREDHHDTGSFKPWLYNHFIRKINQNYVERFLFKTKKYLTSSQLNSFDNYCYFPLNSEPEVSIQVLGKPYHKSQIELIRNIAINLPVGMKLLLKDHPRSHGMRKKSFYEKIFETPNIYFINPKLNSNRIISNASLVTVISGTLGLEAILKKKPVILFGYSKYNILSGTMMRECFNLYNLSSIIKDLLENYLYDEVLIKNYLAATIAGSVKINLYSKLLNKPNRYSPDNKNPNNENEYDILADYTIKRLNLK